MKPMIHVRSLEKRFVMQSGLTISAIQDLSLDVGQGEFVAVLGPSGCGKSTLLQVVGGLQPFANGCITINQKSPFQALRDRTFGFVFQRPVLFRWRTVLQNVCLPGEIFQDDQMIRDAHDCIMLVGLNGFESSYPGELSGGMQSRVALARALSFKPQVLLMDEPFGALDELTRMRMNTELLRIWGQTKSTVVFVTHSIAEAVFLADRVVLLTERPAREKFSVVVDLPRPRSLAMLEHPDFQKLCHKLRLEMGLLG